MNKKYIRKLFSDYSKNLKKMELYRTNLYLVEEKKSTYLNTKSEKIEIIKNEIIIRNLLYMQLDEEEKYLVDLIYEKKLSVQKICKLLYISDSTLYRKRRKIFEKLSEYLDEFQDLIR